MIDTETPCPLCGSRAGWQLLNCQNSNPGTLQCKACQLVKFPELSLVLDPESDQFDQWTKQKSWEVGHGREELLRNIADLVLKRKLSGKILDVGCSIGPFFANFPRRDWQLYGVEVSKYAAEIARKRFGAQVAASTLAEAGFPSNFFDVVTFLDTLYYIQDPAKEIAESIRVLKDDGLLLIEIPNFAYSFVRARPFITALIDRERLRGLQYDAQHRYLFPTLAVVSTLLSMGLAVNAIELLGVPRRRGLLINMISKLLSWLAIQLHRLSQGCVDQVRRSPSWQRNCLNQFVRAVKYRLRLN